MFTEEIVAREITYVDEDGRWTHVGISWGVSPGDPRFAAPNYTAAAMDGLLLGLALVLGGFLLPRKVLVTDGAVVLKTRSPLFFRIPFQDIESVEPVHAWQALGMILSLQALPFHLWLCRGLLIRRKSGPDWVIHTTHDTYLRALLSWHAERARTVPKAGGRVESQALASCQTRPLASLG